VGIKERSESGKEDPASWKNIKGSQMFILTTSRNRDDKGKFRRRNEIIDLDDREISSYDQKEIYVISETSEAA